MAGINGDGLNERSRLCSGSSGGNYRTLADTDDNMGLSREDLSKVKTSFKDAVCGDNPVTNYARNFCTIQNLKSKVPSSKWIPKYRTKHFIGDLVAGLTVGLTVIPQGMAYAQIAELPPQYGLYSAFMGGFIYCFFGTSKDITLGPTAIMSLLVAEFASERSPIHDDATYAIILTLISGLITLAMGLLNLGFIVQFISYPVISGFTSAAAIVIAMSQVKKWLGLTGVPRDFIPQLKLTFEKIPETNLWDFAMGLIVMVILIAMKKLKEHVDTKMKTEEKMVKKVLYKIIWLICTARNAVLVIFCAMIAAIMIDVYGYDRNGSQTNSFFSLTGKISDGVPVPQVPKFSINKFDPVTNTTITRTSSQIFSEISDGFIVVSLIGLLESIAIGKAFARKNEYQLDSNQELIAIGLSNTVSAFFHSYPVTGSFSRTAINSQSGVRTPAGAIWTGALVLLALGVLTPYFQYIPQASLAAVIIVAVILMVDYEIVPKLFKVKKLDLLPLAITFFLTLFVNIEYGIIGGVGFSVLILIFPMARPGLSIRQESLKDIDIEGGESGTAVKGAYIIEPNQGLKFPGVEYVKDKVMKYGVYQQPTRAVILNARHLAGTDYSAVQGITQLYEYFTKHNYTLVIACATYEIKTILLAAEIKGMKLAESEDEALQMAFGQYRLRSGLKSAPNGNAGNAGLSDGDQVETNPNSMSEAPGAEMAANGIEDDGKVNTAFEHESNSDGSSAASEKLESNPV